MQKKKKESRAMVYALLAMGVAVLLYSLIFPLIKWQHYLICAGVAENLYGSRMFSQYLGLEDSFIPGNFAVSGGSAAADELRGGRYLEIVEFSDFQVSPMNGDIAGEIRLGYLHDGDTVTVVEGGSVSGTMRELASTMRFSREQKQYNNYLIPALTRLTGVSITGAEG